MKNKKSRHESSSENSEEESEVSKRSEDSSSESESEESSGSERRHKKKRRHTESSVSESDSVEHKRSKKRKHKKKKKKHGKKKRRDESEEESDSEKSSVSEGEIIKKKKKHKRKHKHNKRSRSPSVSASDKEYSDAGEIRGSDRAGSSGSEHPSKTYYQKDYPQSGDDYQNLREREVQRFYRGSSKDRRPADEHHERYQYSREHAHRYSQQEKYERSRERPRYEERGPPEEQYHQHRRPREEGGYHQRQHDGGGYNRYNPYEHKGPRRRDFEPKREYPERHNAPEERYHGREYPDKRQQRYKEENFDRARDYRRERPVPRSERPPSPEERPRSRPPPRDERHQERREKYEERRERYEERRDDRRDRNEERRERRPEPPADRRSPKPRKSRFADTEEGKDYQWGKTEVKTEGVDPDDKEKPNFGLSGKLTADANTVNGVVVKYTEPDDARQPKRRWRFYPFKGEQVLPILYIHRQSAFLMGRDKKVVDIHLEHPSVSKQHAALQYRATPFTRPDGSQGRRVRPYIIDLDSANGTFVNNKKIEARRYVELLERDVVKFGFSAREYVLLHENSKDDEQDDDHHDANAIGANVTTTEKIKQEKRAKQAAVEDGD